MPIKSEKTENMFEDLRTMGKYIRIYLWTSNLVSAKEEYIYQETLRAFKKLDRNPVGSDLLGEFLATQSRRNSNKQQVGQRAGWWFSSQSQQNSKGVKHSELQEWVWNPAGQEMEPQGNRATR